MLNLSKSTINKIYIIMDPRYLSRFLDSIPKFNPIQARFVDWLGTPTSNLRIIQPLEAK